MEVPLPEFLALQRDIDVDVLIVGGGVSRLRGRPFYWAEGVRVALIDRERIASADIGSHDGAPHRRDRRTPASPGK